MHQDDGLPAQTLRTAAKWLNRVRAPSCGDEVRQKFVAWLRNDPRRLQAVLEMYAIERVVDRVPKESWERLKAVAERKRFAEQDSQPLSLRVPLRTRFREASLSRQGVLIASFFIFAAIVQFVARELAPTLQTTTGEQRMVELQDGSRVHLNTNTRIRVQFSDSQRIVELLPAKRCSMWRTTRNGLSWC